MGRRHGIQFARSCQASDVGLGHKFIRTFRHSCAVPVKRQAGPTANVQAPGFAGRRWLAAVHLQRSHDQQRFYRMIFNKRSQGANFNIAE